MAPILETVISILFVFLVFSLITSWIVEYVSMRLTRRGKMLREFIINALEDRHNSPWGLMLYSHPLIDVLHRYVDRPQGILSIFFNNKLNLKRRLPAYIPSDQFATALIDLICNHGKEERFVKHEQTGKYMLADKTVKINTMDDYLAALSTLKASDVKSTLAALAQHVPSESVDAMAQLHSGIRAWYENGMERLGGWYKRSTRKWLFAAGLVVAVACNVDTIVLVKRFYADPQLRGTVAKAAESYLAKNPNVPETYGTANLDSLTIKINALKAELDPLHLPIGWDKQNPEIAANAKEHWLGWLLTALALSFGAPFWFDALKKVVNVRSAGVKPASSDTNTGTVKP